MSRLDYHLTDFRDDGTLRVSATLWLVSIFLSRHLVFLAMGALSTAVAGRQGLDTSGFSSLYSDPVYFAASLPAVTVIAVSFFRRPGGGPVVRGLWRSGRWLLIASASINLALILWQGAGALAGLSTPAFVLGVLDVYALVFLVRSTRTRDTFADFPAPRTEPPPAEPGPSDAAGAQPDPPVALPSLSVRVRVKLDDREKGEP